MHAERPGPPVLGQSPSHGLATDGGQMVYRNDQPSPADLKRHERLKEMVEKAGGYVVSPPKSGCNCHGHTFDGGAGQVREVDVVDPILSDNYSRIDLDKGGKAQVCDVIVYGGPIADHSGLVVEIDANGKPVRIESKWSATGGVFVHPPEVGPYGSDWAVHRRKSLPQEKQDEVERLRKAYDKAVADHGATSRQAHRAAAAMCQTKNALKRT